MVERELSLPSLVSAGAIAGVDVSPDGRFICFGSTASGISQIYIQDLNGGEPVQITHGAESATQPKWSPRGDLIAFLQDVGGDENYGVYVLSPEGGEPQDVSHAAGKLHENIAWSWDGTRIAYVSNRDGQFDVYYSDVDSGTVHRVTNYPAVHHAPEFSPDGTMIAFASNRSEYRSNWDTFVVSLVDGTERKVTQHEGEADEMSYYANHSPRWAPDGRRILVASSVLGNYDLMTIDVQTLEREWIVTSSWNEGNGQWSPDGSHVSYVLNVDGNLVLHVKNLGDGRDWPVSPQEGVSGYVAWRGKGGDYRWTPDGSHLVYSYSGPTEAGSIWLVPTFGGEAKQLVSTMPDEIDRTLLSRPTIVHYPSFDGREISAFLFVPKNATLPVPGVVIPHGGPTYQTINDWDPLVQYLVNHGYAVLEPNFRGSLGYGREFQWLNKNDWGGGDLRDLVEGANWLEREGIADRLAVTGGSYGGFLTFSAITRFPERWQAAAAIFAVVNLLTMYTSGREDMKRFVERNIGTPDENPEFFYQRSPINFVENIQCPVLLLQGERDARTSLAEAEQMRDRLAAAGKEFEYVAYAHEGHAFSSHHAFAALEHRVDYVRRITEFFDRHLSHAATMV